MRESELPSNVSAQCGTVNSKVMSSPTAGHHSKQHESQFGHGNTVDGHQCRRNATVAVENDDSTVEVLTCKGHIDEARETLAELE